MASRKPVRVIAVTSGKGGVGKTSVSVNLAIAMATRGRRVLLMDADLGLGNADVLLGLRPRHNLSHVISGECNLDDIIIPAPGGVKLLPASSGVQAMSTLSTVEHAGLVCAFSDLGDALDTMIVDTAAGISDSVITFSKASQEVVVVVCDEPASLTDGYALIKVLHRHHDKHRYRILANMVRRQSDGRDLFLKLLRVTTRFLDVSLDYIGAIPYDEYLIKSVRKQCAVIQAYPRARASLAFKAVADAADDWKLPDQTSGQLEFFLERMVDATRIRDEARP